MIAKPPKFGWGGLNTKADATGLPLLECVVLQDMRVVGTDIVQRLGMARIGQLSGNMSALDLGTNQACTNLIDTRVWALGLKWTVETAIELDSTAGTQGIFTAGHTTPAMMLDVTGGNIRLRVWDSVGTLDTITVGAASTSIQTVQITRDGSTLSTRLDNGTAVTATMSETLSVRTPVGDLRVGLDDGANYINGTVDYLRVMSITKSDHADRLIRLPNPRAAFVMADYDFKVTGTLVYDRSRYENHLIVANAPSEVTSLCHTPGPIRAMSMGVDKDNKKQLLVLAGGKYYISEVA